MNLRLFVIAAALSLSGCMSLKHVSGQRFVTEYCEGAFGQNSAWSSYFVGHSPDRAYLEYWHAKPVLLGGGTRLHWAKLAELPPAFAGSSAPTKAEACGKP